MRIRRLLPKIAFTAAVLVLPTATWAQDDEAANDVAQANNALAANTALNFHDYFYNMFVEPQWSVADDGAGWPEWQVFVGLNTTFK